MANKIGQLVIELAANTARLQQDLGKAVGMAERAATGFKKAFSFVSAGVGGGVIGAALISAAKNAIEFGDSINKAATKAGIGGKAMSELAYAAKLADVDIGSLSVALKKMQVSISEAGTGSKQAQEALGALGLTVDQLQKRKPEAQFELIADRISKLTDPADRARAATELFGKAGADLLPMFAQGAEGIAQAVGEARKLGLSFSADDLDSLSTADDSIKRLSASWEGFATTMTAKVAPALSDVLDRLVGIDTRSAGAQVASISKTLANMQGLIGPEFDKQRKDLQERLSQAQLQQAIDQQNRIGTGTFGGPQNRRESGYASGYAKRAAEEAAAAQQFARDTADVVVQSAKISSHSITDLYSQWADSSLATYDKETVAFRARVMKLDELKAAGFISGEEYARAFVEAQDEVLGEVKVSVKKMSVQVGSQLSETAQLFKDQFIQAFEDMINTGKFQWRGFLSFLVAEFAKRQIGKLFEQLFSSSNSDGGGSGIFGSIFSAIINGITGSGSSASIDGKASGGTVKAGSMHWVGEKGPELALFGSNANIIPNHALMGAGDGPNVTVINHIDARGATVDAIKLLPSFGKQISDATEERIVSRLRRDYYGLSTA